MFTLFLLVSSMIAQASDTFPLQFALREKATPRTVVFQGVSTHEIKNLCNSSGQACSCVFYSRNPNRKPVRTAQVKLNLTHNSASCQVPAPVNPELLSHGQLMNTFTRVTSEKLPLRREISLQDLLGPEAASKVNAVFNYNCQRTFLEGEGVSPMEVSCPASQRLGLIHTT